MSGTMKILYCVLLVALMGEPGLAAKVQISWAGEVTAGFSTTFTCSSSSSSSCFPNCNYTWSFKGRMVSGKTLIWTPDGLENTVELQCTVLSPETGLSSTATTIIEIKNPLSVQISPPHTVPSLSHSLDLVCHDAISGDLHVPLGLVWYKDGQKVTLHKNMQVNNLTLHFDSLLPSDAGFYQCEAALQQTRVSSLGYLLSFDPWNVSISGPDSVFVGRLSQFTCLTSCIMNVECTVKWRFRGGFPIGTYFSLHANEIKWTPSIPGTFQNFICIAENAATGRFAETTKLVEVKGTVKYQVGSFLLIAISVSFVLIVIILAAVLIYRKRPLTTR